jgi:hypothetical protein
MLIGAVEKFYWLIRTVTHREELESRGSLSVEWVQLRSKSGRSGRSQFVEAVKDSRDTLRGKLLGCRRYAQIFRHR